MPEIIPYLPGFIAAYAILLVGASSPGPAVAMLVGIATEQGRGPSMVASLGIAMGSMTLNILTLLGVGLLLSQAAWAMSALRVVGAGYLLYLAYGALRKALNPPVLTPAEMAPRAPWRHFAHGYLLQVTNPKAVAFWLAIASVGAVEGAGLGVTLLFVAGAFTISLGCHAAWGLALSARPVRAAYAKTRRGIEATLGAFFLFAAFKLATSGR
ncbi:LysE family translocator [uncultured Roseovarius sp.]|uniref:LysE family translocator n=1 Tax=uncultured Roseovarius sp. TaxID=293344 RepID=UPI0025DDAEC4|nr:LysE family translocator [uncultured Roseovarius sp.]